MSVGLFEWKCLSLLVGVLFQVRSVRGPSRTYLVEWKKFTLSRIPKKISELRIRKGFLGNLMEVFGRFGGR